ncbi:rhodopsin-like [Babylonia areolata]|uniref:rhodopsin-like n=1 Tax=Babylonia areolata TaxID=304850 RepID=UPI003FD3CC60
MPLVPPHAGVTFAPAASSRSPPMKSPPAHFPARDFLSSSTNYFRRIFIPRGSSSSSDSDALSLPMDPPSPPAVNINININSSSSGEEGSPWSQGPWRVVKDADRLLHPHWLGFQPLPHAFHVGVGVAVAVIAVGSLVGNAVVLSSIFRFRSLRTSSNMFLISLALAEILMGSLALPLFAVASFVGHWPFGYYVCQFYATTTGVAGLVTINTLAAISFDRYNVVVRHGSHPPRNTKKVNLLVILIIWLLSTLWATSPVLWRGRYTLEGIGTTCTFDYLGRDRDNVCFVVVMMVFNFAVPLLVIVFSYTQIFMSVLSVQRGLMDCSPHIAVGTRSQQPFRRQTELKTASTILMIICFFCLAWTPYVVVCAIGLFGDVSLVTPLVSAIPCVLAKAATVSNPPLYSLGHPKFRKKISCLLSRTISREPYYSVAVNGSPRNNAPPLQSSYV